MKEEKKFTLNLMQKVPGGLIIVPMLIGVLANTFIPNVLEIGGFTSGMFKTGTSLSVRNVPLTERSIH